MEGHAGDACMSLRLTQSREELSRAPGNTSPPRIPGGGRQMPCSPSHQELRFFGRRYDTGAAGTCLQPTRRRLRVCNPWRVLRTCSPPPVLLGANVSPCRRAAGFPEAGRETGTLPFAASISRQGSLRQEQPRRGKESPEKCFVLQAALGDGRSNIKR